MTDNGGSRPIGSRQISKSIPEVVAFRLPPAPRSETAAATRLQIVMGSSSTPSQADFFSSLLGSERTMRNISQATYPRAP
jgi:hypothetical protein